jgi:uncharacterized protein YjdB
MCGVLNRINSIHLIDYLSQTMYFEGVRLYSITDPSASGLFRKVFNWVFGKVVGGDQVMIKVVKKVLSIALAASVIVGCFTATAFAAAGTNKVTYQAHLQDIGWQDSVDNGVTAGTTGQSRRLEAVRISLQNIGGGIKYRAHVQDIGWQDWVTDGAQSGTTGQSKRLEAIQISLTGSAADLYDVYYRVHVQDIGWQDWVSNGATAGTTGMSKRAEAIEIQVVTKGSGVLGAARDTRISVSPTTMSLTAGGAAGTLTASVTSLTLTDKSVTWTSSNTAVATVSGGVVTPLLVGTTTITAATIDGIKATSTVTVTGGGTVIPVIPVLPTVNVSNISIINAAEVTFSCDTIPTAVTWDGQPATVVSYNSSTKTAVITVPRITRTACTLVVSAGGYTNGTLTYTIPVGTSDNLLVMSTVSELGDAIASQKDGQSWIIESGTYDLDSTQLAKYGDWTNPDSSPQAGWYFPIHADNLIITGEGSPVVTSSVYAPNGSWASQNFITVWGDDLTIDGLNIRSKQETNKAIEVMAGNFTLKNAVILPNQPAKAAQETTNGTQFSGSIYFNSINPDIGSAVIENVRLSGWIAVESAITSGTVTLKNSVIDFRNNFFANYLYDGTRYEYGVISKNSRIISDGFKVLVDNNAYDIQGIVLNRVPANTTVELASGTYYVPAALTVPIGVKLDTTTNGAVIVVMPADTVWVSSVSEFKAALSNTSINTIRMAAGTYEFDKQITIDRPVSIIGAGASTILKVAADLGSVNGSKHALSIEGTHDVTVKDVVIDSNSLAYGVNVYLSGAAALENVLIQNSKGAGLTVNGSAVTAANLSTGGNAWGGINVDPGAGVSVPSSFTLSGTGVLAEATQIWSDGAHVTSSATVTVIAGGYTENHPGGTLITWSNK